MTKRFSSRELFKLRNNIPVDLLIRDHLQIPSKIRDGFFRFLCPLCNEFQTAVNPATNLARCFRCEKNFNTIDLVMVVRNMDSGTVSCTCKNCLRLPIFRQGLWPGLSPVSVAPSQGDGNNESIN